MKQPTVWRAVTALGVLLCVAGGAAFGQEDEAGIALGTTPRPVTVETLEGKPVALAQVIGRQPALIEFWATWCPLCRALEPRMSAAHARYGSRVRFITVAVAVNESRASVRRHLARHPAPYAYLWDANGDAVRAFDAPSTSFIVLLDAAGKVVYTGVGSDQNIDAALARLVKTG